MVTSLIDPELSWGYLVIDQPFAKDDVSVPDTGWLQLTVVRAKKDGGCEIVREGAISLSQISAEVALG